MLTGAVDGTTGLVRGRTIWDYCGIKPPKLIVPGTSVGKVYLGQTRRSLLKTIDGLRPGSSALGLERSPAIQLPGGLAGFELNIALGVCNPDVLDDEAGGALKACKAQWPKGNPNVIGGVATTSTDYATRQGIGPGSSADDVVAIVGSGNCAREIATDPDSSWDHCKVPGPTSNRFTYWGFTGPATARTVLAAAVFDTDIVPAQSIGASDG